MKYFLVFTPDRGSREDCSVFYSNLVIAKDEEEAKEKFKADHAKRTNKYRKKNNYPLIDEAELIDGIEFVEDESAEYSDKQQYQIMEINPIV